MTTITPYALEPLKPLLHLPDEPFLRVARGCTSGYSSATDLVNNAVFEY
jgi:hypothetical protein